MTANSATPTQFLKSRDGVEIAYVLSGSDGPLVVFVHATGFCKELSDPLIEDMRALGVAFRALSIDQRGHGDSGVPDPPFDWWQVGGDLVELVGGETSVIGVGHSSGGAVLAMAELLLPGVFTELVLVEPILLPPPYIRYPDNPMSAGARRRRPRFASRQAAFDNFMAKPSFAGWQERAMWAYVTGGMRAEADGYVLKCRPEVEAEFFAAATTHGAWDRLHEIAAPTLIIAGENSTTHHDPYLGALTERFDSARCVVVPGTSHFVWMEQPAAIAAEAAAAVRRLS